MPHKALIIDDEQPARSIIAAYLNKWGDIELVGECANGFEALKAIRQEKPHILFLDIQMPKVTGLELLEVLDEPVHVIFTTAYDQYALKAFELNAVDYLLKPFEENRFDEAVNKVLMRIKAGATPKQKMNNITLQQSETLNRVVVKKGSKLEVIALDQLRYIEAQDDYVMLHSEKGQFLKLKTMKQMEEQLPVDRFIRIHRSYIVNTSMIMGLEPYNKDTYMAILSKDCKLKVSRTGYKKLREQLDF